MFGFGNFRPASLPALLISLSFSFACLLKQVVLLLNHIDWSCPSWLLLVVVADVYHLLVVRRSRVARATASSQIQGVPPRVRSWRRRDSSDRRIVPR